MASDGDSDEDFVTYGAALEPLEEDEPLRKPLPVHEQTVKDEKGRYQRFHGAFTGGFSAGYFNTVGSKEGWTPSTFVSSRQQKAEKQDARPEDFMDEEDLGEHGIAPKEITTSEEFFSSRRDRIRDKARAISSLSAPIPGDSLLEELIAPARSSIGVELLRKMGWKDGQGVGPRVKRKSSRQNAECGRRVYGCASAPVGSEESEQEDDEEFAPENVTFAPKDITPIDFNPKVDVHGLGYRGLDPAQALLGGGSGQGHVNLFSVDSDRTSRLFGDKNPIQRRRGGVAGQAFGVGALEDDDEDVYHRDNMSNYDTVLGEESGDGLYGWTAPQQYRKNKGQSRDASYLGKILQGFRLASKPAEEKTVFPAPVLPRDYRPVHYFRPVVDISNVSPLVAQALQASRGQLPQAGAPQVGRHQLDSAQRRSLLGETALQGPSSIMELLSSEDRERLTNLRQSSNDRPSNTLPSTTAQNSHGAPVSGRVTAAQTHASALMAWSDPRALGPQGSQSFRPFENNPSKQARYDQYLSKLKMGDKDALETSLDRNMTEWERSRERDEFSRAALLYKPSASSLSSRFTRAKHEEDSDTVEVSRDEEGDVDDKQAAVKMKMFGKLTRETYEWHPDKLLCKRFNIPDPYPGSGVIGMPKVKRDKFSVFNFLNVAESPTTSSFQQTTAPPKTSEPGRKSRWDARGQEEDKKTDPLSEFLSVARNQASGTKASLQTTKTSSTTSPSSPDRTIPAPPQQTQTEEPTLDSKDEDEEDTRPPMDLFKAIFASSSDEKSSSSSEGGSEDEEDEKEEDQVQDKIGSQLPSLFTSMPTVTSTSSSQQTVTVPPVVQPASAVAPPPQNTAQEEEEFGPKLPPPSSFLTGGVPFSRSPPAKEEKHKRNKDKHKAKKQHKHKEKKKKKHKKHKHKGKQQKKKKKEEASDSSSEESGADKDDGSGQVSAKELLSRLKTLGSKQLW
ncbi:G patch domain-containing protein 1 [Lampris incognitus]|uniref:G patch domain-containing protein 1 n=1 Tax=Lampris incognitus TaxID=2546036 RepID=UPI0024B52D42|nr:G patch domain-containing protein 1 [Lampris incognitus]